MNNNENVSSRPENFGDKKPNHHGGGKGYNPHYRGKGKKGHKRSFTFGSKRI